MATEQIELKVKAVTKKAEKEINNLNKALGNTDSSAKKSNKTFDSLKTNWIKVAGIAATVGIAVNKAFDLAETAAKYNQAVQGMEQQFGVSSDAMLRKLREMSGGTVSDMDLIESANRAMALNVTKDIDQMGSMMQLARVKARVMGIDVTQAFNDIATGVGRNSPMILDWQTVPSCSNTCRKPCEFSGSSERITLSRVRKERCNDYPEREYSQVAGSARHPVKDDDIVSSLWEHKAA
jgi:hypothetical protein